MQIRGLSIFIFLILAASCLEPYYPDAGRYEDLPVITGTITDEPGPYVIRLTHSTAILDMEIKPIRWAVVKITDDSGTEEVLFETEPGVYVTKADGIRGVPGNSYRLTVETNGEVYQSDYEILQPSVGIDSVYSQIGRESVIDGYVDGIQFFVNSEIVSDPGTNLLWSLEETYKFRSEYELDFIYYRPDSIVENYSDSGLVCWGTERPAMTYSYAFTGNSGNKITGYPLHFVNSLNIKLTERYSVEVFQYTISDNAYNYWSEVQSLHQETGSLYSRQPYQVKGNLYSTTDPEALVLGYFMAAGVSKKRAFVDRPPFIFNYEICNYVVNLLQVENPRDIKFPVFAMQLNGTDRGFADLSCFDCRLKGGTMTEPDFWIEKDQQ